MLPVLAVLAVLLIAFMVFTALWTDLLWYRSVHFSSVFTTMLWARVVLFVGAGLFMALVVGANVMIAHRLRPAYRPLSVEQQGLERYRTVIDPRRKLITAGLLGLLAVLTGSSVSGQWPVWLAFLHRTSFGQVDPQFHKDISFYVFTYPFLRLVLGVVFATVILSILAAVMVHYLYGGLRLQGPGDKASPPARAHLSVLVGVFILLKAFAYWFDRYGLVHSERGVTTGASYTDVNALLPAKTILAIIALICAALFFSNLMRRGMMLPGVGFTLLVLSAILVGGLYPLLIQQFQVKPDELAKERQFIQRNIEFTRKAYGVGDVRPAAYGAQPETDTGRLQDEAGKLDGVRLLDPTVVGETFQQLQRVRPFYRFPDTLDVDRYKVTDGGRQKTVDTIVALRELSGAPAGQKSWVKDRMVYTHGYGFVSAYGDRFTGGGEPEFLTKDMPSAANAQIKVDQPQIYYGEHSPSYSVVGGAGQNELDYPDNSSAGQENTTYKGSKRRADRLVLQQAPLLRQVPGEEPDAVRGDQEERQDPLQPDAARHGAPRRALAHARRRPVPDRGGRQGHVDRRRVHHLVRLPLLRADQPRRGHPRHHHRHPVGGGAAGQRPRQLHAQLGQGDRGRLRRHRQALPVGREGPGDQDLDEGLQEHRGAQERDPGGAGEPLPLPAGHVQGAAADPRQVPRDRPRRVLQR